MGLWKDQEDAFSYKLGKKFYFPLGIRSNIVKS